MNNDFKNDDLRDLIIERDGYLEQVKELQQELQRKDNNWNELKKYVMSCYIVGHTVQNGTINQILDKINELEGEINEK